MPGKVHSLSDPYCPPHVPPSHKPKTDTEASEIRNTIFLEKSGEQVTQILGTTSAQKIRHLLPAL
jgi:hypothetical protein